MVVTYSMGVPIQARRGIGPGASYVAKQTERGKDTAAALRLLRRRLSDTEVTAVRVDEARLARPTAALPVTS